MPRAPRAGGRRPGRAPPAAGSVPGTCSPPRAGSAARRRTSTAGTGSRTSPRYHARCVGRRGRQIRQAMLTSSSTSISTYQPAGRAVVEPSEPAPVGAPHVGEHDPALLEVLAERVVRRPRGQEAQRLPGVEDRHRGAGDPRGDARDEGRAPAIDQADGAEPDGDERQHRRELQAGRLGERRGQQGDRAERRAGAAREHLPRRDDDQRAQRVVHRVRVDRRGDEGEHRRQQDEREQRAGHVVRDPRAPACDPDQRPQRRDQRARGQPVDERRVPRIQAGAADDRLGQRVHAPVVDLRVGRDARAGTAPAAAPAAAATASPAGGPPRPAPGRSAAGRTACRGSPASPTRAG